MGTFANGRATDVAAVWNCRSAGTQPVPDPADLRDIDPGLF